VRVGEVTQLVQLKAPTLSRTKRVLGSAVNVDDFRRAAARALPRGIFDYLEGGAEDEVTMHRNRAVFDRWGLMPSWGPVTGPDLSTTVLGRRSALPLTLTPTGATRLFHPDGELAVARAAARAGIPYGLAGLSTVSLEAVATANPTLDRWFNFGLSSDRGLMRAKLDRCEASGYNTLVVGLDVRALGSRERDRHNGFTAPPALTVASMLGIATRPGWWLRFLAADGIRFPNLEPSAADPDLVTPSMWQLILGHSDASKGWDDVSALRSMWAGRIVLKGCVSPADTAEAAARGVDAVQLSNHGGRQLDRMLSPLDVLRDCRDAVGSSIEIIVDSGIRRGTDILTAIALGADACAIGRPYLYGLAAAGTAGVSSVIQILAAELERAMTLVGVSDIAELTSRGSQIVRDLNRSTESSVAVSKPRYSDRD
jgi:L-lactate dehydrogenase (cytochrome)